MTCAALRGPAQDRAPRREPAGPIGTLRVNPATGVAWLEFRRPPGDEARGALRAGGWRWSGDSVAWFHGGAATPPAQVRWERGGACDYEADVKAQRPADHRREEYAAVVRSVLARAREVASLRGADGEVFGELL